MYGCNKDHVGYCPPHQQCQVCGCQGRECAYMAARASTITASLFLMLAVHMCALE